MGMKWSEIGAIVGAVVGIGIALTTGIGAALLPVGYSGLSLAGMAVAGAYVGYTVGTIADVFIMKMPDIPSVGESSPTYAGTDIQNTIQEGIPIARAYGYCQVGGNIVRVSENTDNVFRLIVAHCQGPVSEIIAHEVNKLPFDDHNLGIGGTAWPTRNMYAGTSYQMHDSRFSGGVSSAYRGVAYSAMTFGKTNQIGYQPTVVATGLWYCPCDIGSSGTSTWSNNPAHILYDWYVKEEGHLESELEATYFSDLAEYCQPATPLSGLTEPIRPALDGNTVTATSVTNLSINKPLYSFDAKKSKIGNPDGNGWISGSASGERIQADFGQPVILDKVVIENYHSSGGGLTRGIKNFDVRATNDITLFTDRGKSVNPNWSTAMIFNNGGASFQAIAHVASDTEHPQSFTWSNSTPYRYWALQIKDSPGGGEIAARRIEFQGHLGHRYTFDYVFDSKITKNDAKKMLWESFRGAVLWSQGKLKPIWESAKDVAYNFTMDNIVHGSLTWGRPKKPNLVRIHYIDGYNGFSKTSVELKDEQSIRERGEILHEETCWWINNGTVARRRCKFLFDKFQATDYTCKLTGFPGAQGLEPFDRIRVTHSLPGWTLKDFIVKKKSEDDIGRPILECESYHEGLYQGEEAEPQANVPASNLPSPFASPAQVTGLTLTDISSWSSDGYYIPKINVTYTKPTNTLGWAYANIYISSDGTNYYFYGADQSGGSGFLLDASTGAVEAGSTIYVKVLSVNVKGIEAVDDSTSPTSSLAIGLPDIQTTFDNAPATGGRFVLPKGTYTQTAAIAVPDKPIQLVGCDRESVIIQNDDGKDLFVLHNLTKEFLFTNFTITSQNTAGSQKMFNIYGDTAPDNTAMVDVNNITFNLFENGTAEGDYAFYGSFGSGAYTIFRYCLVNGGRHTVYIADYADTNVSFNTFVDQTGFGVYIFQNGANTCKVVGNKFYNQQSGAIWITTTADETEITGNKIQSTTGAILNNPFAGITYLGTNAIISGNQITLQTNTANIGTVGIYALNSNTTPNQIRGNFIKTDVSITVAVYGIWTDNDTAVVANTILIDDDDTTANHYGIRITQDRNIVTNNFIDMINSDAKDIGVYLDSTASDNQVSSNNFVNTLDYLIVDDDGTQNIVFGNTLEGLNMSTNHGELSKRFL